MSINVLDKDKKNIDNFIINDVIFKERYSVNYIIEQLLRCRKAKNFEGIFNFISDDIASYGLYHLFSNTDNDVFINSLYTSTRIQYLHHLSILDEKKYTAGCDTHHMKGMKMAIIMGDDELLKVYFRKYPSLSKSRLINNKSQHNLIYYLYGDCRDKELIEGQLKEVITKKGHTKYAMAYFKCMKSLIDSNVDEYLNNLKEVSNQHLKLSYNRSDATLSKYYCENAQFLARMGMKVFDVDANIYTDVLYISKELLDNSLVSKARYLPVFKEFEDIMELLKALPLTYNFNQLNV